MPVAAAPPGRESHHPNVGGQVCLRDRTGNQIGLDAESPNPRPRRRFYFCIRSGYDPTTGLQIDLAGGNSVNHKARLTLCFQIENMFAGGGSISPRSGNRFHTQFCCLGKLMRWFHLCALRNFIRVLRGLQSRQLSRPLISP